MSDSLKIPLGFRFDPTDEELLRGFLYPRIVDPCLLPWDGITDRMVYGENAEPWNVFSDADDGSPYYWHSKIEGGYLKKSIYVFTNLIINKPAAKNNKSKKKPNPNNNSKPKDRASRIAGCGKWAGQTGPKEIMHSDTGDVIGSWKMFTFECNKREDAAKYTKDVVGHWIMHEYSFNDPTLRDQLLITEAKRNIVLCKITKWIEIKNNNNKNKAEVEAVQNYYLTSGSLTGEGNHVNCNNKRSVGEEITEEEELGNCNKKQKTSTTLSSSSSSSCLDDLELDHDLQQLQLEGCDNIDMNQLIADLESDFGTEDLLDLIASSC